MTNDCNSLTGAEEGICALGGVDATGNPDLSHRLKNVHVSSLYVHGFSDTGVLGFNTAGFKVSWVRSDHNGGYGIARFVSINSTYEHNSVSYNDEAGLYMGDSPNANSVIKDNEADHNGFGIFLRDSSFQTAEGNKVWANCIGILALNTTGGGTPAADVGNYTITDNLVWANNKACPASEGGPALSGIGVALASVKDTVVQEQPHRGQPTRRRHLRQRRRRRGRRQQLRTVGEQNHRELHGPQPTRRHGHRRIGPDPDHQAQRLPLPGQPPLHSLTR